MADSHVSVSTNIIQAAVIKFTISCLRTTMISPATNKQITSFIEQNSPLVLQAHGAWFLDPIAFVISCIEEALDLQ